MMNQLVGQHIKNMQNGLFTATMAEIIKIDWEFMRCDVQPLFDDEAKPIVDVPFGFMQNENLVIRFPYKKGDKVFLVFCKEDIAPILFEDGNRDMAAEEKFREDDAFVIGGVHLFTKLITEIPKKHDESLLICRKDFKSRIEIDKDGKVIVETDQDINFKTEKNINFDAPNGTFKVRARDIDMQEV